jgi:hypothetical protein
MGKTTWADMTDEALVLEHQYLQRLIQTCSDDLDEMLRKHPHNSAYRSPQYRQKNAEQDRYIAEAERLDDYLYRMRKINVTAR